MSDLRSLKYSTSATVNTTNFPTEFLVKGSSSAGLTANDGGCCCLWTVPAGTTWITFEIWGGGGTGGYSCCCQQSFGGGAGAYSVKSVCSTSLAGCTYTICAGGSSGCSQSTAGCAGNTSYVNGYGLSNFCAAGGGQGCSDCWRFFNCYQCKIQYCCACANGGDLMIPGYQGDAIQTQFCGAWGQGYAPHAPATSSGPNTGAHGCQWGGGLGWPCTMFPGGGGQGAVTSANACCYSAPGNGGLVSVTYG